MELQEFVKKSIEAVKAALASTVPDHQPIALNFDIAIQPSDKEVATIATPDPAGRITFSVTITNGKPSPGIS